MRILGIVCSPRKAGNTEILVREALRAARETASETELFRVADKRIAPCSGCQACEKSGICRINDDMQQLYKQLELVDGLILGTPVYFLNVTAQAKAMMDRTYALLKARKLRGKVAAAIVAARRVGAGQVIGLMYTYFMAHGMIISGAGIGYGLAKGEVRHGVGGSYTLSALQEARAVGRNVVRDLIILNQGHFSEAFQGVKTNEPKSQG